MARVPSVAQTEQTIRPLAVAVRKLAVTGRSCASCGSPEIRPSSRRNALDILLACLFIAPFRCRVCRERFYRVWRPSLQNPPDPPTAPLLVMPARRQVVRVEAVAERRIEPEPLVLPDNLPRLVPPVAHSVAAPPSVPDHPLPAAAPGSVLILESDLSIRKLLRRLLERRGYSTVELAQADDIESQLREGRSDLLVVDVAAFGLDALIALARAHPSLKILALSAESLQGSEIPGRFLALPKPFPLDSFVDCVDRLLGR